MTLVNRSICLECTIMTCWFSTAWIILCGRVLTFWTLEWHVSFSKVWDLKSSQFFHSLANMIVWSKKRNLMVVQTVAVFLHVWKDEADSHHFIKGYANLKSVNFWDASIFHRWVVAMCCRQLRFKISIVRWKTIYLRNNRQYSTSLVSA